MPEIKAPERRWRRSDVFLVNTEQTSYIVLVFPLLTLNEWMSNWFFWSLRNIRHKIAVSWNLIDCKHWFHLNARKNFQWKAVKGSFSTWMSSFTSIIIVPSWNYHSLTHETFNLALGSSLNMFQPDFLDFDNKIAHYIGLRNYEYWN